MANVLDSMTEERVIHRRVHGQEQTIPSHKKFDGKWFSLYAVQSDKNDAIAFKEKVKLNGANARIVEIGNFHAVYMRLKN
jgi:hypothetical protein